MHNENKMCACPHLVHQCAYQFGLKDVSQRDPVEKTQESLQCGMDQRGILGIFLSCKQGHKQFEEKLVCKKY